MMMATADTTRVPASACEPETQSGRDLLESSNGSWVFSGIEEGAFRGVDFNIDIEGWAEPCKGGPRPSAAITPQWSGALDVCRGRLVASLVRERCREHGGP